MEKSTNSPPNAGEFWYPLDNAAKIYPAITNDEVSSVFRLSVNLKQPVKIKELFKAVRAIEPRFPYYHVQLRKGVFWYYLESTPIATTVEADLHRPCRSFHKGESLLRVLVSGQTVSVEFSHMLADGGGAFAYFSTLLVTYFELIGLEVPADSPILHKDEKPDPEEFEDAYLRYFQEDIPALGKKPRSFHLPFYLRRKPRFQVLQAMLSATELKQKSKENGVSVTEYLTAVYFAVLQDIFESLPKHHPERRHRKLAIEVPINLRKMFPSKTMRNFSLFVMPELDLRLGHYDFDEILKSVYLQMRLETDPKLVNKILALNVGGERNILIRSIPLFVKSVFMRYLYYAMGSTQYCGTLTNMGVQSFPEPLASQIECLKLVSTPPNKLIKVSLGVVCMNDNLVISFGSIVKTRELERRFVRFLTGQGLSVRITTQNDSL